MFAGAIGGLISGGMGLVEGLYQAQVAENNAKVARWQAANAEQMGEMEQQDQDNKARGFMGELVASQGASGLSLGGRSAIQTRSSAAKLAREDALRIRYNASREAYNYKVDAMNFEAQAGASKMGAAASLVGGFVNAATSLVSNASSKPAAYAKPDFARLY